MPHLIIESTQSLEHQKVTELHLEAAKQETIKIENLKTRLYLTSFAVVADNQNPDHIAINLKLLPGRSEDLKKTMSLNLINKAKELFPEYKLSVEITDLGTYQKA